MGGVSTHLQSRTGDTFVDLTCGLEERGVHERDEREREVKPRGGSK